MNRENLKEMNDQQSAVSTAQAKDFEALVERKAISPQTFSVWIRRLLQGWRQGTVGVKGRADVSLSGKKPWKQKGTGRARAGTAKSPLWRKGGVIHGPQPRVHTLKINKKQKSNVLNALLWNYLDQGKIYIVQEHFEGDKPKTAFAHNLLQKINLVNSKLVLFVESTDVLTHASFMNLPNVNMVYFDEANAFDLANSQGWLVFQKDLSLFKEMVSQWL